MNSLKVQVVIDPVPEVVDPARFNELCDGELAEFDAWQQKRMIDNGFEPSKLCGPERGAIKAYLMFVATRAS